MHGQEPEIYSSSKLDVLDIPLGDLADGLEDHLFIVDQQHNVLYANSSIAKTVPDETSVTQRKCYDVFESRDTPCGPPLWTCPLAKVIQTGKATTFIIRKSGKAGYSSDRYVKTTIYPLKDQKGDIYAITELRRDVTAESQLEHQIMRRHHQLRALNNISSAVTRSFNLENILKTGLDNALEIISGDIGGILLVDKATQTLSYRIQHGLSSQYTEQMRLKVGEGVAGHVAQTGESILIEDISKDPRTARPDLVSAEGLKGFMSIPLKARNHVVGVMNISSHVAGRFGTDDVSLLNSIGDYLGTAIEQARLYAGLARAGERYKSLLQHALTAQEQERKRIAREIHDETSQSITSLTLSLQAIIGMAEMKGITDVELIDKLKTTHSYAVYAGQEIVKLMKELRPTLLDELGMPIAIQRYAKDVLQAQDINVTTDYTNVEQRLPPEVEVTLFRVAQGAIGNILEHSEAKNVIIKLHCADTNCELRIEDDGKGFDVSKITKVSSDGRGAGVFTMKERVRLIDGVCRIESKPGHGTEVIVNVPIAGDITDDEYQGTDSR